MTRTTESTGTALVLAADATSRRAARGKNIRRAGVIVAAACMVAPFALPAFAAPSEEQQVTGLARLSEAQQITSSTAGSPELDQLRQETYATTPEELETIRQQIAAEEAAAAAALAEQQAAEEAAAADAAAQPAAGGTSAASTPASAATPAASGQGGVIANAALDQIGEIQDCVQLVRDSLAAAGLPYSGMGNLFNLGPTISQSQATPGDVIYYADGGLGRAHVAIYIGNGQAVHGGWSGNQTVVAGTNIGGSSPVFIDVG